jgi:hypothetical protein
MTAEEICQVWDCECGECLPIVELEDGFVTIDANGYIYEYFEHFEL